MAIDFKIDLGDILQNSPALKKAADMAAESADKLSNSLDNLGEKSRKKIKPNIETKQIREELSEAQKIIQEYGKGGRSKYLVSEEAMIKNLTKAYEQYGKAVTEAQKKQLRNDVMRWGNAYRGAGYDTKKIDKQIFDFADQVYGSYDKIDPTSGKKSNQMHIFSKEYFGKLFDAMIQEAGGNFDFTANETHWAKDRRDTDIGKRVKDSIIRDVKKGVEDASKEKIDVPIDDILNVEIGKGKNNTIQKKIGVLRDKLEDFYKTAYDDNGNAKVKKSEKPIDDYIRVYSEYAEYMDQIGGKIEERYKKIYDTINKFSPTRSVIEPSKTTGDLGRDDFKQLKDIERSQAKSIVTENIEKAIRKAEAQLAIGIKPSAKAAESGEDSGEKIASGMKKAAESADEAKEKIEQVGEAAKSTREAVKSAEEAEKMSESVPAEKIAEAHHNASAAAEEHASKAKEAAESIQEEIVATQQLNAEQEKSSQQGIQDNTAQQAKENEEALHKQAEAQREVNDAKEQSNDKSKLSSASQEISQVEQMEAALDFQKKKLYDLQKQAEAVKQVYDDLQDRNEYIKARRNVKGTKDKPNPFGLDGNLDKLYEQVINHINRKEPNMAKAAAYYGFYRNAGGKDRAVVNGEDFTKQLVERWNAIQKLNKAIREGSINASNYGVDSLNAANEAIREQQRIVDNVTEKVRQTKKEAAEQRKAERELAAQEYEDSKTVWSYGLNEQEIAGVEAYLKKVKALKKEAYNETDALAKAMSLVEKIKKRDVSGLMDQFTKETPENNALLGKITGMEVRSQKQRNAALRSVNQEQYDQLIKGQTEAIVEQGMQGVADASKNAGDTGATAMGEIGQAAEKASSQVNEVYEAVEKILNVRWNGGSSSMALDLDKVFFNLEGIKERKITATDIHDNFKRIVDTINLADDSSAIDSNFKKLNDYIEDRKKQLTRWITKTDKDSGWDVIHNSFDSEVFQNLNGTSQSDAKKLLSALQVDSRSLFNYLSDNAGMRVPKELKSVKSDLASQVKNGALDAISAYEQLQQKVQEFNRQAQESQIPSFHKEVEEEVAAEENVGESINRNNLSLKERIDYLKKIKAESKFLETAEDKRLDMEDKAWDAGGNNPRATEAQSQGLIQKYEDHISRMESADALIKGFEESYEEVIVTMKNGDNVVLQCADDLENVSLAASKIKDIKFVPFGEGSSNNAYNFASDIKSLEGYSSANEQFVSELIASVVTGQKEYDAAMEELKSHIAQRQEEIRAEQERNLRVNTEIGKFASGAQPILDAMGLAEDEARPQAYIDFINQIQNESINGEEAVKQFAEAVGYAFDEASRSWQKVESPASEQHKQQEESARSAAEEEKKLSKATEESQQVGSAQSPIINQHKQQEESARSATAAEEELKGATKDSSSADTGAKKATENHKEQQKAAEDAADAERQLLQIYNEAEAGANGARLISERYINNDKARTKTYELAKGLTATGVYVKDEEGNWSKSAQSVSYAANYNTLLQDTVKWTKALETAQASLNLAYEKQSDKAVIDSLQAQIKYYQEMIDKNNELAETFSRISLMRSHETGSLPYTKEQYDTDVSRITKEIQLKVGQQSAEQIERQQARNEAELKKNQAEIDKANHYVTQQIQRLRDVENRYDSNINAQASRGITSQANLDEFKRQVKEIEDFINSMKDIRLDPSKMDQVTSMFGELKRFGDNAYLEETAKKGDLSRQSVDSMKKVLSENIGSFLSTAKLSKGDTSNIQNVAQQLQQSISGMVSGDEVSAAFTKLKELRAELKNINDEARLDQQTQKEASAQYDEHINKIKALIDARSQLNEIQTRQLKGEPTELSIDDGLENVKNKAIEAEQALSALFEMWNKGLITDSDFYKATDLLYSEDANYGSMKSRTEYAKAFQKAIEELGESYIKLADAQEKAEHSKTIAGKELAKEEIQRIKDRQEVLKTRLGNYNIDEDEYIRQAKHIANLKTAEYEEKRNAVVNTKGLGFGEGDNIERTWDVLIQKASQYQQILFKRDSGGMLTVNEELTLQRLAPLYEAAEKQATAASEKYTELQEKISGAKDVIYGQAISQYENIVGGLEAPGENMPQAYNKQVQQLRVNLETIKNTDIGNPEWFATLERLKQGINDLKTDKFAMPVDESAKVTLNRRIADWINKNSAGGEYLAQMEELQVRLSSITSQGDLEQIAQGFENIRASAADAGRTGLSFGDGLIKRFKSLGQYLLSFASFYRIIGTLKQAVNIVKELDSGLMEVRKVAKETDTTIKKWQKTTFNQADAVGGTASQIEKSTASWLRLGKSFTESMEAAQASVKLLNVSEFTNIDDATTSLVSMRQAFQDLSYEDFIDKLNGVGDNFSSSTDQLAQGMQNVSAVLKVAGNDIDQSLALLTAANNITQDMSKASMGIRTVALRISGTKAAKEELEELGEDTSDFVVQTESKVDAQVRKLTATASNPNGISVLDENGRLRDTYDILLDIAKVYEEIVEKDNKYGTNSGNALLELLAGKTRSNILASILQAPDILEQAYETSKNSQGVGQRELDVYLDSIEARIQKLQNRLQELAFTTFDSDFIKTVVDGFTQLVSLATELVDTLGALPTLLGVFGGFMAQKSGYGILPNKKGKGGWAAQYKNWFSKPTSTSVETRYVHNPLSSQLKNALSEMDPDAAAGPLLSSYGYDKDWINSLSDTDSVKSKLLGITQDDVTTIGDLTKELDNLSYSQQQVVVNTNGMSNAFSGAISIGKTLLSTVGTIATTMLVSFAIQGVITLIGNLITMQQRAIDAGKEAQDSISSISKSYNDQAKSINEIKDEYAELSEGVSIDKDGIKNVKLSSDEFSRFLELNQQLSEIAPELVSGYDSQGNAIVNLGNTVDGVNSKFEDYLQLQKDIANAEIGGNLDKMWIGLKNEAKQYKSELSQVQDVLVDAAEEHKNSISAFKSNGEKQEKVTQETINITVDTEDRQKIHDILYKNDLYLSEQDTGLGTTEFFVNLSSADDQLLKSLNSYYEKSQLEGDVVTNLSDAQVKRAKLLLDQTYNKAIPSIQEYIKSNTIFDKIDDSRFAEYMRSGLSEMISKIDYYSIEDDIDEAGGLQSWVDGIIAAMSVDDKDVRDAFTSLFQLEERRSNMTVSDYISKRTELYKQLEDKFGEDYLSQTDLALMFGNATKDENGVVHDATKDRINAAAEKLGFGGDLNFQKQMYDTQGKYVDQALSAIESLPKEKAKEIAGNWEAFWKFIEPYLTGEAVIKNEPINVLSDLFGDEVYKENAEKYKSNLSSVTTALQNLKAEGSISPEDMVGLQELFPNLTDFSYEGISKAGIEQFNTWINEIAGNWEDYTPEGLEQLDTYIKNLTLSYSDLAVSAGDARTAVFNSLMNTDRYSGMSGYEKIDQAQQETDEKIQALKDEYGEDLNWNIVLALQDYFSGDVENLINKYGDYTLEWNIKISNEEAEAQINRLTSERGLRDAQKAYEESLGKTVGKDYYEADSEISRGLIEQYQQEIQNAAHEYEKSSKDDKALRTYQNAVSTFRQSIYEEMSHISQNDSSIVEAEAAPWEYQLNRIKNEVDAIQQNIDDLNNNGQEVAADQYQALIDKTEAQVRLNQGLADYYTEKSNEEYSKGNYEKAAEFASKANEYSATVIELNGHIIELRDNMDSIDNTHLSNALTQLQNKAEDLEHSLIDKTDGEKAVIYVGLQINAEEQKKNLEAQRQEIIDDFQKKHEENGIKYSFNDPEYQTYLSDLKGIDDQLQSLTDSQREWSEALLNTPIDAIDKKIDEYDTKLEQLQDRINLRESKGGRKTAEDYDTEADLYSEKGITETVKQGLLNAKSGILGLMGYADLSEEAKKQAEEAGSQAADAFASSFTSKREKKKLPLTEYNDALTQLQQHANEVQRDVTSAQESGKDVEIGQYDFLIANADQQIKVQEGIINYAKEQLKGLDPTENIEDYQEFTAAIDSAYEAISQLESGQRENQKSRIESIYGAPKLERELADVSDQAHDLQNEITRAEQEYGKASDEQYNELADLYEQEAGKESALSRIYDVIANWYELNDNNTLAQEYREKANTAADNATQKEADALEQRLIPYRNEYNELQHESEQIQRQLTKAEQKHQKVSKKTYQELIANGKAQIQNMKQQQQEIGAINDDWWDLQNSIDSMNDSMYDWSNTMNTLIYDQASQLSSTLWTAISESMSDTGLTTETINALLTGFSDLTGKDLDVSDAFYNTTDGVKVNTQALQELTEAEYDLIAANLAEEIQGIKDKMVGTEGTTLWDQYNDKLQNLMQTQSQFFAQYQSMQRALSHNNRMEVAESTENAGANYDANYDRYKKYKEQYDKGLVGTDEFKEWTAYADEWGRSTYEAYENAKAKLDRYFTEDGDVGTDNFLQDLKKYDYASQDADGYWTIKVDDMNEAAHKLGMGMEFFQDMMGKLEDYDFTLDFIGSETERQLKVSGLRGDLEQQMQIYNDMLANGATTEELQAQLDIINDIADRIDRVNQYGDDWLKTDVDNQKKAYANLQKTLDQLGEDYNAEGTNVETKEALIEQAKKDAQVYGLAFDEELARRTGEFKLTEESQKEYDSRMPEAKDIKELVPAIQEYVGEIQKAQEWGVGEELSNGFTQTVFGNVDMDKRQIINWSDELKETYKDALASWDYEPEVGGIDTVYGSSGRFGEDIIETGVEVAFTPIMNTENGTEFLSEGTVYDYIEQLVQESTENGVFSEDVLLELDKQGRQIGDTFVQGIIAGTGDEAYKIGDLMHFSGDFGAMALASESRQKLEAAGFDNQFMIDHADTLMSIADYYDEDAESVQGYLDVLKNVSREELEQVKFHNDAYDIDNHEAEDALEKLADYAGISTENIGQLLDVLDLLGIDLSQVKLPSEFEALETYLGESGTEYQISTNVASMSLDELNAQMDEIEELELDPKIKENADVYDQLQELKEKTESQIGTQLTSNIEESGVSTAQLKQWASVGDKESIANALSISVDSTELDQYIDQINNMPDNFDMSVHIDDTQFNQLVSAIVDPWSMLITADTSQAEQQTEEFKEQTEKKPIIQTIQQKIQSFGNAVAGFLGGGQKIQTNTAEMDTSGIKKGAQQAEKATENVSKAKGTATADINIAPALMKISALKAALASIASVRPMPIIDQTSISNAIVRTQTLINKLNEAAAKKNSVALGTAHALGTTSLSRAYVNGKDWTVGRNESALVNEIGQESRVRDGVWELIPGGPHVEDLKKDDIIFNAQQTADLIRTGKTARSGKLVSHAKGTVPGMSAYVDKGGGGGGKKKNNTTSDKKTTKGGKGGSGGNNKNGKSNSQNQFEKWLEKLFDWIEVRLDRIQRAIDNATQQAENEINYIKKNNFINTAMSQTKSLISNNQAGQKRYQQQANAVLNQAVKTKQISKASADRIQKDMASGKIAISQYDEKTRKVIDAYKTWYEKALDCRDAVYKLQQQVKELQQTKLDNIVDQFETITGLADAVKSSSEATVDYYTTVGRAVNTVDKTQLEAQKGRQDYITEQLKEEAKAYYGEMMKAQVEFGKSSNEYRNAQIKLEEINKSLIESQKEQQELRRAIRDLSSTVRGYFIDRVKALVDKLGTIQSLAEKRGTNNVLGYSVTENPYFEQTKHNNELILKYYEDIQDKQNIIKEFGYEVNSEKYHELYKQITEDESAIISLLSTNEDLKESIRTLRWKPYEEFQEKLNTINSDLQHLQSFIRDGEILDDDGQFTQRGFAQIALIGEQMDLYEKKIGNAEKAIEKLNEEREKGLINEEKYNEELDAQIDIIQDASSALFDSQTKLADMYIDQITAENDALQDLISARKEALNAKKEYYDWDKTLRNKNKDIAQLQAQINALNGVTTDSGKARRAKLQAQLQEKQEDLRDTLYQHSIEVQQEGYDKLSTDMQESLDKTVKLINGDQKILQETASNILQTLQTNSINEAEVIQSIIDDNATRVHESTESVINALKEEGGVESLLSNIGVNSEQNTLNIKEAVDNIKNFTADSSITQLSTDIITTLNSNSQDISGKLSQIESAILSNSVTNTGTAEGGANVAGSVASTPGVTTTNSMGLDSNKTSTVKASTPAKTTTTAKTTAAKTTTAKKSDPIKDLLVSGKARSKNLTSNEKKKKSNLWQYIVKKYGHDWSDALTKKLASLLKISVSKTPTQAQKTKILNALKKKGYASGTKRVPEDLLAWTNEDWDKYGSEIIVRPEDNAILTPLKANDSVIPANLADNLFKWGAISPDKFITNPFVGKWGEGVSGSSVNNDDSYIGGQTVEMHFDSLFHIEGNVDESVMLRLENLGKSLVNDRDFQKNVIKFVTKDFVRESKKQGIR